VASPLWFGLRDGRLYIRTGAATAKLQRIRHHPQVRVAPSTVRGTPLGPPFVGQARILDRSEEPKAERAIRANYRWFRRVYLRLLTGRLAAHYVEVVPVDVSGRDGGQTVDSSKARS
jgi:PPOX class probable F420-dependent enzyme